MNAMAAHETHAAVRETYDIDVADVEYAAPGGKPLLARVFTPRGAGPFPLMIDLHGGAWCNGDRTNDTLLNEALARSGFVVAALDFRMPPDAGYPASLVDINGAVRWFKAKGAAMKIDASRVGLIGISSGGHQAMLAAMRPTDPRYLGGVGTGSGETDARVGCVVLCWPVIDPLGRYRYGKDLQAKGGSYPPQIDRVLPSHDAYWGSESAMAEGNPVLALERGESVEMPPILCIQGDKDLMHPRPQLEHFVSLYRQRGGEADVAFYEGEVEGFVLRNASSPRAAAAQQRIIAYVHRILG
jgi:acetyl esterase/lipase